MKQPLHKRFDSLFTRLALVMFAVVISSHALVLSVMWRWHPLPPPPPFHPQTLVEPPPPPAPPGNLMEGMVFDISTRLLGILLASWWAARWITRPIQQLAHRAQVVGQDVRGPALQEEGPRECRDAIRVFNHMQQRICAQMAERDLFVAAVSHDLRTPLTRLALRAEALSDPQERLRFRQDIGHMEAMIRSTLDVLRGEAEAETWVKTDLFSLVDSLIEDAQEAQQAVEWFLDGTDNSASNSTCDSTSVSIGAAWPAVQAQPVALRRCLTNLIDNALRYGQQAEVRLLHAPQGAGLLLQVLDRGPGIPEAQLDAVCQPFVRLETSRNRATGGVGLGLAIARDIARRHGGQLQLSNRPGGGLCASLHLPTAPMPPTRATAITATTAPPSPSPRPAGHGVSPAQAGLV